MLLAGVRNQALTDRGLTGGGPIWNKFDIRHDSVSGLPTGSALIRALGDTSEIAVLAHNLRTWVESNRAELSASIDDDAQPFIEWSQPDQKTLQEVYIKARGAATALRQGRPTGIGTVQALFTVPQTWGLYRIQKSTGEWYVGISSNIRARLQVHARSGMLAFPAGDRADYILAKQPGAGSVITWLDLQEAERQHIQRLANAGATLVNRVAGGNGLPPADRFFVGNKDYMFAHAVGSEVAGSTLVWKTYFWQMGPRVRPFEVIDTGIRISDVHGEWDLKVQFESGANLLAMAPGKNFWVPDETIRRTLTIDELHQNYLTIRPGRSLVDDLQVLRPGEKLPDEFRLKYFWPKMGAAGDKGSPRVSAGAVRSISEDDVHHRRLPVDLAAGAVRIDERFRKGGSVNAVVRLVNDDGSLMYVKVEENTRAVRAEVLASLIWFRLGWPGITDRTILSEDRTVLIIPPVGGVGIQDQGTFDSRFKQPMYRRETKASMAVKLPSAVVRITLADLQLADDHDVTRFLMTNAAWGNSDRHSGNIKYGWRPDPDSIGSGFGCLLPLDHGRCFLNNGGTLAAQSNISGTPTGAVTGQVGNPHQLLRPFSELVRADREGTLMVIEEWGIRLMDVLRPLSADSSWKDFTVEIAVMIERIDDIRKNASAFIDDCAKVVLP